MYGGIESGRKGQKKGLLGLLFSKKVPPHIHNQTLPTPWCVCFHKLLLVLLQLWSKELGE